MNVAIAHDYLTQRGGAERVVLSMVDAFPSAPVYTTLYDPDATFPEFRRQMVRASPLNRVRLLRRRHRLAFPLLAPAVSHLHVDADVVVCSSSGWAHAVSTDGARVVYCHAPARWLYQRDVYMREMGFVARSANRVMRRPLMRWDRRAAASADRYLVNSSYIGKRVRDLYGRDAEVLPAPPTLSPSAEHRPVEQVEPGFVLCVSRLLSYKNVDVVVEAFAHLPDERLVVVGDGPDRQRIEALAGPNVTFLQDIDDAALRWLYANCRALVAASFEDYGLTPLEAATFGKPTAALRFGGFLDTVVEGETGLLFDRPEPSFVGNAIREVVRESWSSDSIAAHAETFSQRRFVDRLRDIVEEVAP